MQNLTIQRDELDFRSKEAFKTLRTNVEFSGSMIKTVFFSIIRDILLLCRRSRCRAGRFSRSG